MSPYTLNDLFVFAEVKKQIKARSMPSPFLTLMTLMTQDMKNFVKFV